MTQKRALALLAVLASLVAGSAIAASGTVTFVAGDVTVQRKDGSRVAATKGTVINAGDSVETRDKGMAQVAMVDQAKISLRPNTQVQIEQYADRPDSDEGASLNLVRGTMRTFTGLIASKNRDKFQMKTKVATVGIRGSGNVLFAGTATDCDPAKLEASNTACDITVNHTIEGSHSVTFGALPGSGLPSQQGGAQTLITGPGQTVLVTGRGDVRYIPTPQFIADSATNPLGAVKSSSDAKDTGGDSRNFGPSDSSSSATLRQNTAPTQANTTVQTFPLADASGNLVGGEPLGLQDIVIAGDTTLAGQALQGDIRREGSSLRGYRMYPGLQVGLAPSISGGVAQENRSFTSGGLNIYVGRWEGANLGFFGPGSESFVSGSVHWIVSGSGFPAYLSDVLTGTARYTPVIGTSPTNQLNTLGTLTSAQLDVNFSTRRLDANFAVTMPAARGNAGGSWQLTATDVPFSFGTFFASTSDRLRITNNTGQSSQLLPSLLSGSFEGSFVGSGLQGAVVGYTFTDQTLSNPALHNTVNGVVGFQGPIQNTGSQYRDGLVSDPTGALATSLVRNYSTANRPDEVTVDAQGRVSAFAAPFRNGGHQNYALGSASVAQSGLDPETGLVWGRWAGGVATVAGQSLNLERSSLHYVFSGQQNGPVSLPLTGTANYSLIGSTSPTDSVGNTGTLNSASLAANFTQRTVDLGVNLSITGRTINASALNVPIFREQYFTAFAGNVPAGLPVPQLLNISCQPSCAGAAGSVDGFFAGRGGQGAGMMYNLNGVSGAAVFRRAGG
jgi:hypothetical protein